MRLSFAFITKAFLLFTASLFVSPSQLSASMIYLDFAGTGASGDVNSVGFTNQNWILEYAIDTTVSCSLCDSSSRNYEFNAITGGSLFVDETDFFLTGSSATGQVSLQSYPGQIDAIHVFPAAGGVAMQIDAGYGTIFPALFSNITSLGSANPGASVLNSVADAYGNNDYLSTTFTTATGSIDISATTAGDSGDWSVSVNSASQIPVTVPEPSGIILALTGGAFLALLRLRTRQSA